jgi:hypothetical protein
MKPYIILLSLVCMSCASVKKEPLPNTEIWIAKFNERTLEVTEVQQITQHAGYDNQPCFSNDSKYLLYASDQDGSGSPDVMRYDLASGTTTRVTATTASEFSPTPTSNGRFTAIHVGKPSAEGNAYTESQQLWEYDSTGKGLGPIIPATRIGYHPCQPKAIATSLHTANGTKFYCLHSRGKDSKMLRITPYYRLVHFLDLPFTWVSRSKALLFLI